MLNNLSEIYSFSTQCSMKSTAASTQVDYILVIEITNLVGSNLDSNFTISKVL